MNLMNGGLAFVLVRPSINLESLAFLYSVVRLQPCCIPND